MTTPTLHHAGLLWRPFEDNDAEAFAAAVRESVASVAPWMPWCTSTYTQTQALEWFAHCRAQAASGAALEYGAFCQDSGEFLGGAGLNEIRQQHKLCNLGYWVRQSRQRQGVALRSVQALSRHAFESLSLQRVEIVAAVGNSASANVALKAGALREGVARNRLYLHDRQVDAQMFSLLPPGSPHDGERDQQQR